MVLMKRYFVLIAILMVSACAGTNNFTIQNTIFTHGEEKQENVIFYIAHQDDDVFISSKIQKHIQSGDKVFVVYTCLSYQRGKKYKERRVQESYSALNYLGLNEDQIFFLGFPDTRSHNHLPELIATTDSLFQILAPDIIYTSAYEGGNVDHDVANFVINYLRDQDKTPPLLFEFPEYSGYNAGIMYRMRSFPSTLSTSIRELNENEYETVKNHWDNYKSQKPSTGLIINMTVGKKKTFGYEYLRLLPNYNYFELPPSNSIAYEKYLDATFEEFKQEIRNLSPSKTYYVYNEEDSIFSNKGFISKPSGNFFGN